MKINGEAVYGTSRWTTMKEGPTSVEMKGTSARKEHGFSTVFTSEDFWFTKKDNIVYVISLAAGVSGKVAVKALYDHRNKIKNIKLLGKKGNLKWNSASGKIIIELPENRSSDIPGFALKVSM